eukprot:TRINITY_DN6042_c0_g1_i16.p1 TRINITY_DN6042_c0_g1~~TRINITY_DN6042_c0_g1_i16.p1  ORF type:complete len:233 (-),score=56.23 TRINITY_DN6042_c0_g1_i16:532-1230(-)
MMTSINIPDMMQIVKEHGLVPVPVDINVETTAPTLDDIKAAATSKAKVLIVSYLYGIVYPVEEIAGFCEERGILLVEDAAESYYGNDYNGSPRAVMTLFSFGSIKRYTSFGGALAFVRDSKIYEKMASVHTSFKVQTRREFCKKLVRSFGVGILLNSTKANYILRRLSHLFNFDHKEFGVRNLRGFAPANDFLEKFNKQPSVSLVAFLYDRLKKFDPASFKATNKKISVPPL